MHANGNLHSLCQNNSRGMIAYVSLRPSNWTKWGRYKTRFPLLMVHKPITFHPPGSNWKKSVFSNYNPKISASNSLYFGSYSRKCTYFQYTNFDFVLYLIYL